MKKFKEMFQLKRILTFVLAVAMVVTMVPTTAFAAEMPQVNLEQNEDVAMEEVSEVTEDAMLETTEVEAVEEAFAEVAEVTAEEAAHETVLTMDLDDEDKNQVYTGGSVFPTMVSLKNQVKVTVDGKEVTPLEEDLTLTWKAVGADGKLTDLPEDTTAPVNAGTYYLFVKLTAREGQYKAAEIAGGVEFTIAPAKVYVTPYTNPSYSSVEAGTKVGDIKVSSADVSAEAWNTTFNYVIDNPETKDVDESKDSHIAITVSVREAADLEKKALAADTVLLSNGDYVMDYVASFTEKGKTLAAGNYEVAAIESVDVDMTNEIVPQINVTFAKKWEETGVITRTYTGNEISVSSNGGDFAAKVQYYDGWDSEAQKDIYKDVPGAEIVEEWYEYVREKNYIDAEGNTQYQNEWVKMETAPVDAGTYYYRLSYAGLDGVYAGVTTNIEVEIIPMSVVLVPELKEGAVFYDKMAEEDVLAQVDYKVYSADDLTKDIEVDRSTVWGTSYYDTDETQPYEPVFVLQYETEEKDAEGQSVYVDNNGAALEKDKKYRVIFSGRKAVAVVEYDEDVYQESININSKVTTAELNYNVATDEKTLSKHTVSLSAINANKQTTIDVTEITKALGDKGDSLQNVYTKIYDGANLYAKKADYKKAVVKAENEVIAKATDSEIEYKWYKNRNNSITDNTFSDGTNEPYGENENRFDTMWGLHGNGYSVPYAPGIYKLQITYKDAKNLEYATSTANVYYVIEAQPVRVVLEGEYNALTGQSISGFLNKVAGEQQEAVSLQKLTGITVSGNLISGNEWVSMEKAELGEYGDDWWIEYKVLETPLVEKTDESGNVVNDASGKPILVPATTNVEHYCYKDYIGYDVLDTNGKAVKEESETIYSAEDYGYFSENAQYELIAELNCDSGYTDEKYVVKNYNIQNGDAVEVHQVREVETWEESVPIQVEKMGTTVLSVSVNETALGEKTKVYDGQPFDITAFLGNAVSIVKEDGTVVKDVAVEYTWTGEDWNQWEGYYYSENIPQAVHAGSYDLYVSYAGDTTYAPVRKRIASVTITPAKITLTPKATDVVTAGNEPYSVWSNSGFQQKLVFEGVAEADKEAFTYNVYRNGFGAFKEYYDDGEDYFDYDEISFIVCDEDGREVYDVLKGEQTYTIKGNDTLSAPYAMDYELEFKEATFTTVRGTSEVTALSSYLSYEYITHEVKEDSVSVAINVTTDGLRLNQTIVPVNAIPYSYHVVDGERVYGNFLAVRISTPAEYYRMPSTAMFENAIEAQGGIIKARGNNYIDVILDAGEKDTKTFAIRWEDGYVETFTFDFAKADLMGNLAEAVAPKSIAFNSPTTKMAVGEIQALDLKLTKVQFNDVICISYSVSDETILSVNEYGSVTALKTGSATVTATPVKIENGKKVAIEGAKAATVKITVKPVSTPKIKKVVARDDKVWVDYAGITDGYRREIYVLEGKNIKETEFKAKIAEMKQGQWEDIFAVKPLFVSNTSEYWDWIEGLTSNTDYTVYIRNVSGVRKADNGNNVELSVAGTTKSFKTTKAQVKGLVANVKDAKYYDGEYVVDLSQGKVSMEVFGEFLAKEADEAMDKTDYLYEKLPLSGAAKKTYENPKLSYEVYDINGHSTKLASVDKKGNIKLAGAGTVYVYVWDTNTGEGVEVELYIAATPTKVTGGKTKLNVGQSVQLEDLLTYYSGRKKLIGSFGRNVLIDDALVKAFAENDAFELSEDGTVTAVKEGEPLAVALTDSYVAANNGQATATVTLTTAPLETVKNLKVADAKNLKLSQASLANDYARIQFIYEGTAKAFKIEMTDQRGRIVRSSYVAKESLEKITGKDRKVYYVWTLPNLTQQSKYNVTVTPKYNETSAKAAKVSFTTTKIPASTVRVLEGKTNSGEVIEVAGGYNNINGAYFTSGNAYSLEFKGDNVAESKGSDTLTWTSSNSKVATVKAVSGSYFANLKALRAGTTIIEVKSKITKEVIASWRISVQTVGDGYASNRRYYDENTPNINENEFEIVGNSTLTLNRGVRVQLSEDEETRLTFTAPATGTYRFYSTSENDDDVRCTVYDSEGNQIARGDDENSMQFIVNCSISRGQTVDLVIYSYSYSSNVTVYAERY